MESRSDNSGTRNPVNGQTLLQCCRIRTRQVQSAANKTSVTSMEPQRSAAGEPPSSACLLSLIALQWSQKLTIRMRIQRVSLTAASFNGMLQWSPCGQLVTTGLTVVGTPVGLSASMQLLSEALMPPQRGQFKVVARVRQGSSNSTESLDHFRTT